MDGHYTRRMGKNEPMKLDLEIPGMTLRHWRDDTDYEKMVRVIRADRHSQGLEEAVTPDELQEQLASLPGMYPETGIFLLEHAGEVVAYQTLRSYPEASGAYCYTHHGYVLPEWKGRGLGKALIQHAENLLTTQASQHPADAEKFFQVFLDRAQTGLENLLTARGYTAARYFYQMIHSNLDAIPDAPMPIGIETRPVSPDQYHQVWQADVEAFQEHWGETEHGEEDYQRYLKRPLFQPALWQVAWDGDEIAGLITAAIDETDNAAYNRRRGEIDDIGTLKKYRGRGLAKALIAKSLQQFKALGMTEVVLDVDSENASGALQLYLKMGFQTGKTVMAYRKPLGMV